MFFRTTRRFLWPEDLICSCLQNIYARHALIVLTIRKGTEGFEDEHGFGIAPPQKVDGPRWPHPGHFYI